MLIYVKLPNWRLNKVFVQ